MLNQHLRGTTAALNRLNLPKGSIAIDLERKAIRFYDGETLGGFECESKAAVNVGPGPKVLAAGTYQAGYFGELSAEEFITGVDLISNIGLSAGVGINSDTGWFKFAHLGRVLYVPKTPLVSEVSYRQLYQAGLVYGDETFGVDPLDPPVVQFNPIIIENDGFSVRLLTGGNENPATTGGGEWNALLYQIASGAPDSLGWGENSDADLGLVGPEWVQESSAASPGQRLTRGGSDITGLQSADVDALNYFRPVLELTSMSKILFPVEDVHYTTDYVQSVTVYDWDYTDAPK